MLIPFQACTQQYRTVLTYPPEKTDERDPENLYTWKIGGEYVNSMNILGLVFFSGKGHFFQMISHSLNKQNKIAQR